MCPSSVCVDCARYLRCTSLSRMHLSRQKWFTMVTDRDGNLKREESEEEQGDEEEEEEKKKEDIFTNQENQLQQIQNPSDIFRFLDLPTELRVKIYHYYMSENAPCGHEPEMVLQGRQISLRGFQNLALLHVNRDIYTEFLGIAYSHLNLRITICNMWSLGDDPGRTHCRARSGATSLDLFSRWPHFQKFITNLHIDICEESAFAIEHPIEAIDDPRGPDFIDPRTTRHPFIQYIASLATWIRNAPSLKNLQIDVELTRRFRFQWGQPRPRRVYLEWIHEWMSPFLDLRDSGIENFGFVLILRPIYSNADAAPDIERTEKVVLEIEALWKFIEERNGREYFKAVEARPYS